MSDQEWRRTFLEAYRNSGNIGASCRAAGVDRRTAYAEREVDPAFRAAWDEACEDRMDLLEAIARRRAMAGNDRLLWSQLQDQRPAFSGKKTATTGETVIKVVYDDAEPDPQQVSVEPG